MSLDWQQQLEVENRAEDLCEKCGGETTKKLIGDEIYQKCGDCGWMTI